MEKNWKKRWMAGAKMCIRDRYYKDDFYKEFRTEKELCEYLEEIDSRAEWIRITSKKLKVAAAGEETCTEVPGISLEALEKDTLSHSRLVLILPERICYIGNSAIKSLKGCLLYTSRCV